MKKIILLVLVIITFFTSFDLNAKEFPKLYSKNVIVYDLTSDEILYSKNKDKSTEIASLTKMMTTILAIEKIDNLDEKVYVTSEMLNGIPWDASNAGLEVGQKYTYRDLLYATILPSGADAAHVLAYSLSGSLKSFVKEMNKKAVSIGMDKTHFENVTGYDNTKQYSTASDTLTLLKYALNNETFRTIFESKKYKMTAGKTLKSTISHYNKLMELDISNIKGSKTGNTDGAGLCMAATFLSEDHEIALITIGADFVYGDFYNLKDTISIINFVKDNYHYQIIPSKKVFDVKVSLSKIDNYEIYSKETKLFLPDDYNKEDISVTYDGKKELSISNLKGEKLGKIYYKYKDVTYLEEDILLESSLEISFPKLIKENKNMIIALTIVIIILILYILFKMYLKKRKRIFKLKNIKRLFK